MGLQLARLECEAMAAAARYCVVGVAASDSPLPDAVLAPTRAGREAERSPGSCLDQAGPKEQWTLWTTKPGPEHTE
eukprot:7158397-Pyramimonas_sp.AAC.1